MRRISAVAALTAAGLALAACSGGNDDGDAEGSDDQVEVFTWWAAGSELTGLEALEDVFDEQYPDIEFVNGAVAGGAGSEAKDLLQTRLQSGEPPDTFQAHAGDELQDYIDADQIEDISDLYDDFGLTDAFPDDLIDLLTVDGAIYSIPSNIHRSNVVWANPDLMEDAGVDPDEVPADIDAWIEDLEKIDDNGDTALSVGEPWTQVNLLEAIFMADLGVDGYNGLWDGQTDWNGPEVTQALEHFETLMSFTNEDRDGLDWPDATQQLIDDTAAYNVMGDWAIALFEENDMERGDDFIDFPVPGSDGIFGFLADSFTLPDGAPHPDGAEAWLDTIGSLDGQVAFNKAKGSIPARTDADPEDFSEYQQSAIDSYAEDDIVSSLAHGAATPVAVLNEMTDAVSKFTSGASDLPTLQEDLAAAAE